MNTEILRDISELIQISLERKFDSQRFINRVSDYFGKSEDIPNGLIVPLIAIATLFDNGNVKLSLLDLLINPSNVILNIEYPGLFFAFQSHDNLHSFFIPDIEHRLVTQYLISNIVPNFVLFDHPNQILSQCNFGQYTFVRWGVTEDATSIYLQEQTVDEEDLDYDRLANLLTSI